MCRFLIVLAASCRMVRGVRRGTRLRLEVKKSRRAVAVAVAVEEVGEGRLGAVSDAQYRRWSGREENAGRNNCKCRHQSGLQMQMCQSRWPASVWMGVEMSMSLRCRRRCWSRSDGS